MEKHIKVARAHRALSWLYGIITALFLAAIIMSGHDAEPSVIGFVLVVFGGLFALHYFTGKGASERKPWARNASRGIALFMLFGFPLGTLIGIYLLTNSWGGWESEADNSTTGA